MKNLAPIIGFQLKYRSQSVISEENNVSGHKLKPDGFDHLSEGNNSKEVTNGSSPSPSQVDESPSSKGDAFFKFLSDMLMEDDLGNQPCMLHDILALQATEKSMYDALTNNLDKNPDHFTKTYSINNSGSSSVTTSFVDALNNNLDKSCSINTSGRSSDLMGDFKPLGHDSGDCDCLKMESDPSPNSSGVKKTRSREDWDLTEYHRSNKQLANDVDESELIEMHDDMLICGETVRGKAKQKSQQNEQSNEGKKKNIILKGSVDLRSLLMQCAHAVANFDTKTQNDILSEIRQHSSPRGDSMERVAHYFANALEARLVGTGTALYTALNTKRISAIEILKAYKMFITACPFRHMSNILSSTIINNLANRATTLHIIDFGILYGCQWPCLIHALSQRPGGPPKLRITGIDFPQPGFRPAQRVEDTGRRLAKCSERFGVPFEYNAIAQKWDTIKLEDLKIEKNELLIVISMYRLHNVPDETGTAYSPRDAVLKFIKKINPDMFIHGVANGTYNSPFFFTRFKEAFFHFSTWFDMFEATVPRDDKDRLLYEEQYWGKEAVNIIACEGTERVERPETYKQWQCRTSRFGFRQVPIDQEIVKHVSKVKKDYHKKFWVDEDGKWVLLGWKGRVIQGFSCWRPAHN